MVSSADTKELAAWLRLTLEPNVGPVRARALLAAFGLPPDIFAQSAATLRRHLSPELAHQLSQPATESALQTIERTLQWLGQPDHALITLADPAYPASLLNMTDPPIVLYAKGNISLLQRAGLAIVGARHATPGGQENARAFAQHLAAAGWTIISGLAAGIDAAAHEGALLAGLEGGSTIAVGGTGLDLVYPARHRDLAHRIAEKGLLISELPLGTRATAYQFPRRNRIVAGLSQGVLVVEAARKSGSLITARLASELGREVFAIPGSIHSPLSRGCHALIRQGAKLVESAHDIHEELRQPPLPANMPEPAESRGATSPHTHPSPATPSAADPTAHPVGTEARAVIDALGHDTLHADALIERTGLDAAQITTVLTMLELENIVARLSDGTWQRL